MIMSKILIVGLGNHGNQYKNTRHNIGYLAIDEFAIKNNMIFDKNMFKGIYAKKNLFNKEVFLLKPETYMNLSGQCVQPFAAFFKINLEDIYIVYDDLDMILGKIRYREDGSSGGQKGMKNIIEKFGTDKIKRLKLGIGTDNRKIDAASYVLAEFLESEKIFVKDMLVLIVRKLNEIINK